MNRSILHIIFLFSILLGGCRGKVLNEKLSFHRNDKIPFGAYYAYENLPVIFPDAEVDQVKVSPARKGKRTITQPAVLPGETINALYLIITPSVVPGKEEIERMLEFIREGNHIFISTMELGTDLMDTLGLKSSMESSINKPFDSLTISIEDPVENHRSEYAYPGKSMDNSFSSMDSSITTVLGYNRRGDPNFVRFEYEGGGSLFVHMAPVAFSNFFLLHKENSSYFDQAMSYIDPGVKEIYWDEYFRFHRNGDGSNNKDAFSKLSIFKNDPILKWPFWLLLFLFAMIYFFESKRKQKIIPQKAPLRNASLDFVKTIGRLYYQRKDNKDLANKMTIHFLEFIRSRYNIPTAVLNDSFVERLAYKSSYEQTEIKKILYSIQYFHDFPEVSDDALLQFHHRLEKFYKHV